MASLDTHNKCAPNCEDDHTSIEDDIKKSISELPLKQKLRAVALNHWLTEKKKHDKELEKEIKALNAKYEKLSYPLIQKSFDLIDGSRVPQEDELTNLDEYLTEAEKTQKTETLASLGTDGLPEYWLKVLKNCQMIASEIKEKDEAALKTLTKIEYTKEEGTENMTFIFHFKENEFFSNTILKKTMYVIDEQQPMKADGTTIQWKDGKNLCVKTIKKKQKNKKSGQQRVVSKEVADESFFNFFNTLDVNEEALEKLEDEEADKAQERMDIDFDIAQILVDEVLPYSLEHFLGIKMDGDEEDEEDDEGEDYGDDDEDDEEEEEKPKAKQSKDKKKAPHKKSDHSDKGDKPAGGDGQKPAECKQQ